MTARAISEPLGFTPGIYPVNGASICVELAADGVAAHIPKFLDFNRADQSRVWVNTAGLVNKVTFGFRTGMARYFRSICRIIWSWMSPRSILRFCSKSAEYSPFR